MNVLIVTFLYVSSRILAAGSARAGWIAQLQLGVRDRADVLESKLDGFRFMGGVSAHSRPIRVRTPGERSLAGIREDGGSRGSSACFSCRRRLERRQIAGLLAELHRDEMHRIARSPVLVRVAALA